MMRSLPSHRSGPTHVPMDMTPVTTGRCQVRHGRTVYSDLDFEQLINVILDQISACIIRVLEFLSFSGTSQHDWGGSLMA